MQASRLDPSLALGFYCGSRGDAVNLLERLPTISQLKHSSSTIYQLIEVVTASQFEHLFAPRRISPSEDQSYPPICDKTEVDALHVDDDTCLVNF